QKHPAVGLEVWRRLVIAQHRAVDQVEELEGEFAADHDQRTADSHPTLIDEPGPLAGNLDALVALFIKQADHRTAHTDAVGNPVIAAQRRANLPAETAFAVSRRPVYE